ncbi:MAG TPA: AtpZ/AtpI family protein [Anaerolineales bacterium]|nr:AtpZ/AtpI family protein [Anaerolineae bacterium]HIQ02633.1 AtpZ/AtpI family protein [Anaerolineales bacterium]
MSNKKYRWGDISWMLAISAQGGLMVAMPVVVGLAVGYMLDIHFGTLPWITLVLTLIGAMSGPVLLHRWTLSAVKRRMEEKEDEETS